MSGIISIDYIIAVKDHANGLAGLDTNAQVPMSSLNVPAGSTKVAGLISDKIPMANLAVDTNATALAGLVSGKVPLTELNVDSSATALAGLVDGVVPTTFLPTTARSPFRGEFATAAALPTTGVQLGDYAFVADETTDPGNPTYGMYYYNSYYQVGDGAVTPQWVNQKITTAVYDTLSAKAKAAVPYIVQS